MRKAWIATTWRHDNPVMPLFITRETTTHYCGHYGNPNHKFRIKKDDMPSERYRIFDTRDAAYRWVIDEARRVEKDAREAYVAAYDYLEKTEAQYYEWARTHKGTLQ